MTYPFLAKRKFVDMILYGIQTNSFNITNWFACYVQIMPKQNLLHSDAAVAKSLRLDFVSTNLKNFLVFACDQLFWSEFALLLFKLASFFLMPLIFTHSSAVIFNLFSCSHPFEITKQFSHHLLELLKNFNV